MTFSLKPNPSLYAKLAVQWEAEEARRQHDAVTRSHVTKRDQFIVLIVVGLFLIQSIIMIHKILNSRRTRQLAYQPISDYTLSRGLADFPFTRPKNDSDTERMFFDLMEKRGWQDLAETTRQQMMAYTPTQKWNIVHHDLFSEHQARRQPSIQYGKDVEDVIVIGWEDDENTFMD